MEQEYNYNNTDYEDEFTYDDVEAQYKVVKNEDGTYSYEERESEEMYNEDEETEDEQYERHLDEEAESRFEDMRSDY
ncbi:hypothetical protein [Methanoculleus sp.]|jgi:hypothetical protein|uniref:hypothetical protein n=1 Tax=Methanoculleus sp. TaxID=90427 RepID=UPI0025D51389|nr:hypothetical protein [Methanoculleus sp.]MCK9319600.1 hypothetical protein [Methanoculleus sp.]